MSTISNPFSGPLFTNSTSSSNPTGNLAAGNIATTSNMASTSSVTFSSRARPLTITLEKAIELYDSGLINSTSRPVIIRDTAANIQAKLDVLQGIANSGGLVDVRFTTSKASLSLSQNQFEDTLLLNMVSEAQLNQSGGPFSVTVSAKDATLLNKKGFTSTSTSKINIDDSAENIQKNISSISELFAQGKTISISANNATLTTINLTAKQAFTNSSANSSTLLGTLSAGGNMNIAITDTAQNYITYHSQINTNNAAIDSVNIRDTTNNINSKMSQLLASSATNITSIKATTTGKMTIDVSADTTVSNDVKSIIAAIDKGSPNQSLSIVTDVDLAIDQQNDLFSIKNSATNPENFSVIIKDSNTNILNSTNPARAAQLEQITSSGLVSAITLSGTSKTISASVEQIYNNQSTLSLALKSKAIIKLRDSAANIGGNLEKIQALIDARVLSRSTFDITDDDTTVGNTLTNKPSSAAVNMSTDDFKKYASLRSFIPTGTNVKLSHTENVINQFSSSIKSIEGGGSTDAFYIDGSRRIDLDGGLGDDTLYLVGASSEWQITVLSQYDTDVVNAPNLASFNGTPQAPGSNPFNDALNETFTYRIQRTAGSNNQYIIATGIERISFYGTNTLPAGTVNLKT